MILAIQERAGPHLMSQPWNVLCTEISGLEDRLEPKTTRFCREITNDFSTGIHIQKGESILECAFCGGKNHPADEMGNGFHLTLFYTLLFGSLICRLSYQQMGDKS